MLLDLPTLETQGTGFKFFLWDEIGDAYRTGGGRPDRIQMLSLNWSVADLSQMLSQRLSVFSGERVTFLNDLLCDGVPVDVHALAAHLASGSPRDMIRTSKAVIDEETRVSAESTCVREESIWRGVQLFSEQRTQELFSPYLTDIKRVGRPTFVVNELASDVFHITTQGARAKVQNWMATGIVKQVGEKPNPPNRPMHLYGIVDLRVAITAMSGTEVRLVLGNFVIQCPQCSSVSVSAETNISCPSCGEQFALGEARSLLEVCSR